MSTQKNKIMIVSDVMLPLERVPMIRESVILKEALEHMGRSGLGIACIVSIENKLLGILTDGDFRRKLLKVQKPFSAFLVDDAIDHAILAPLTIYPEETLVSAVSLMGEKKIWDMPVVDKHGILVGLLHLHPAVESLLRVAS